MTNQFKECEDVLDVGRFEQVVKLLPKLDGRILDADKRNIFGELLIRRLGLALDCLGSELDFDTDIFTYDCKYDFILSFEVLEHLLNPKNYLLELSNGLKGNGKLILTTPIPYYPPSVFWFEKHFHEFDRYRLTSLLEICDFEILKMKRLRKSFRHSIGLRPLFRWVFGYYWYVEVTRA